MRGVSQRARARTAHNVLERVLDAREACPKHLEKARQCSDLVFFSDFLPEIKRV